MIATPIKPGHSYRVKGAGLDLQIFARHPVDALIAATYILEAKQ